VISEQLLVRIKAASHLKKLSLKKLNELYQKLHAEYQDWQQPVIEENFDEDSSDG
jgi:hypothetical protein